MSLSFRYAFILFVSFGSSSKSLQLQFWGKSLFTRAESPKRLSPGPALGMNGQQTLRTVSSPRLLTMNANCFFVADFLQGKRQAVSSPPLLPPLPRAGPGLRRFGLWLSADFQFSPSGRTCLSPTTDAFKQCSAPAQISQPRRFTTPVMLT